MGEIKIKGIDKLQKKLRKNVDMAAVKKVVQFHGGQLAERMKAQTQQSFKKGYSKGDTSNSINAVISRDGLEARVGPTTDYSEYVEYGTRFMEAEPFVRPALDAQKDKFKSDLKKLVR